MLLCYNEPTTKVLCTKSAERLTIILECFYRRNRFYLRFLQIFVQELSVSVDPLHVTGLFLYALKISENIWFPDVFRGYRKKPVT